MDRLQNCYQTKTMCGCPTLRTKENRNVDKQIQNCFSCLEPVLFGMRNLPKHTMSTQISRVLFHSRCSACCRRPSNLLCHLLAIMLKCPWGTKIYAQSVKWHFNMIQYSVPSYLSFCYLFFLSFFPVLLRFAFVPFALYFYSVVIVFCIACLPPFSRYRNSRFHELEETFRSVEFYIQYRPVYLDLLYITVSPSACKNLFYRPAFVLPTVQR